MGAFSIYYWGNSQRKIQNTLSSLHCLIVQSLIVSFYQFTGTCFSLATIWEYENMRSKALNFRSRATDWVHRQVQNPRHVTVLLLNWWKITLIFKCFFLIQGELRNKLNLWWNSLHEGEKMFYGLLVANVSNYFITLLLKLSA